MDTGLLTEGTSNGGGGTRTTSSSDTKKRAQPKYGRRSNVIAYGSSYQKAAALVDLAEDGVGIPEEVLDQPSFENSAKLYFIFIRFDILWTLNYFALLALNFFEKPMWCTQDAAISCNDRDYYFLGQLPYLTGAESLIYEGVTLLILMAHMFFPISYAGLNLCWGSRLNKLKVIFLLILVVDVLLYALFLSPVGMYTLPFRVAPYIRVIFLILNIRDLRDSIVVLAGMIVTYLTVLALGLLYLLFSSWLAYVMFEDTEQGKTVFTSFGATTYQMFVLFTTSNNPDVWIPAYKVSRWYSLFFILYELMSVYFVTNLILAVVYDSFRDQLAKQICEKDRLRKRILKKAFNIIDEDSHDFLNIDQCIHLFEELNRYRTLPDISRDDFELIFAELDDSNDFKINLDEFYDLCNVIALRFQKEDSVPWLEKFPTFYNSLLSRKLKGFVRSKTFEYVVEFLLILNIVTVIIETTLDVQDNSGQKVWQTLEFAFGWLYVLEMALKVYTYGFENYWRDGQNRFDFIITWVIVVGETATFVSPDGLIFLSNGEWIRYLLIARMLRLIRLLMHVRRYRAFVATFLSLIPSLMPYLGTIFCFLCFYCSLGVQFFGGIVNAGNPYASETDLADSDYLLFNFNDFQSGMITLHNLLVQNNWQIWIESYKELTSTAWTYAYFVSFYVITVLLLLNLVVAFVLEAFFAEMELEDSEKCEGLDKDSGRKDRRRNVGSKSRSQRVDILLHHMLGPELHPDS